MKQAQFLALDADDALYGGAAGGGKSDALLMDALRGADVPGYSALIVRRTFPDLSMPGAIMDRAAGWLRPTAARWSEVKKTWVFPSGARLMFGYLETENDKYRYQGPEFINIGVDELTQFQESQYRYLRSRLRKKKGFPLKPHSRAASNPGGRGHKWVYDRYVGENAAFPFLPAGLADNAHIDQEDYLSRLNDLDDITRKQLRDGEWVVDSQGLIYPLTNTNRLPEVPQLPGDWYYVLGVDLGASLEKPTTAFAVCGYHRQLRGVFCLRAYKRAGMSVSDIAEEIESTREAYGGLNAIVVDEGALGAGYGMEFRRRHALATQAAQKRDKNGFRKLIRAAIENAKLMVVESQCEDLLEEAGELRFDETGEQEPKGSANHCTDALLYAWRECRAYAARTPEHRPAPGSREADQAWEREQIERERREVERQRKRRDVW